MSLGLTSNGAKWISTIRILGYYRFLQFTRNGDVCPISHKQWRKEKPEQEGPERA